MYRKHCGCVDAIGLSYSSALHDITNCSDGAYSTERGCDLVAGWGSPDGSGLINALALPAL